MVLLEEQSVWGCASEVKMHENRLLEKLWMESREFCNISLEVCTGAAGERREQSN